MKPYGNHIVLTVDELVKAGMSEGYMWRTLRANRIGECKSYHHISDPSDARRKLIFYHTLPARVQDMVKQVLCEGLEPDVWLKSQELAQSVAPSWLSGSIHHALESGYIKHINAYSGVNEASRRLDLAKAAAIMELAIEVRVKNQDRQERASLQELFNHLQDCQIPAIKITNYVSFARKVARAAEQGIYTEVKIPREGNDNRLVMGAFQKHLALAYYGHPKAYTIPQVYELMTYSCEQYGQKVPAEGTVKNFLALKKNQLLVDASRRGEKHYRDHIKPYIVRTPALYPSDLWVMDGTRLNMLAVHKGKPVMYDVFMVIDAHTGVILGFDLAPNEDRWMVFKSLKMSVERTGHLPGEILSDNSSAIKSQEVKSLMAEFEGYGVKVRNAKVGNARDKVIERLIDTLQTTGMKWWDNYVGAGITAQKRNNNRPSPEWLAEAAKSAPELSELIIQFTEVVNIHNEAVSKGKKRIERFRSMDKPSAVECDLIRQVSLLWMHRKITMRNALIRMVIRHEERVYRVWEYEDWKNYEGTQVTVKYDEMRPDSVFLFNNSGEFICEAHTAVRPHAAQVNQTEFDEQQMIRQQSHFEKMDRDRKAELAKLEQDALDQVGIEEFDLSVGIHQLRKDDLNSAESQALLRYVADQYDLKPVNQPSTPPLEGLYFDDQDDEELKPFTGGQPE